MLTRKDFEKVAAIILNNHPVQDEAVDIQYRDLVDDFIRFFEADNPRFDRQKFLTACGF